MSKKTRELYRLAKRVKKLFYGYRVSALDPGIQLTRWEKHDSGKSTPVDTVYLSEMAARCLVNRRTPRRVTRKDM